MFVQKWAQKYYIKKFIEEKTCYKQTYIITTESLNHSWILDCNKQLQRIIFIYVIQKHGEYMR